jgi:hypothetical protein
VEVKLIVCYAQVYFACTHPYSLDRGEKFYTTCTVKGWKMKSLCSTLGQRNIQQLSLKSKSSGSSGSSSSSSKATVIILARVHPGEPVGSWAVEGIINAVSKNTRARHSMNWLVFPMLNPDGVAHGNSRCSFAGCDLNRQWQNPENFVLPEIYYVKKAIAHVMKKGANVVAIIDLHGHSAKQACLFYGCPSWGQDDAATASWLPAVCESMCPVISLANSTFNDPATKQGTARIVGWKHMGVANSLTLEISMGGGGGAGSMSPWAGLQLNPHHYRSIGSGLVNALVAFVTAADPPSPDAWVVPEWIIKVRGLGFESLDFFLLLFAGGQMSGNASGWK